MTTVVNIIMRLFGDTSLNLMFVLHRLSSDFRAATRIVDEALGEPQPGEVLVRRAYAGINASDVNFTAGRYFGSPEQSQKLLPFHAGFESVGVVAALGKDVKGKPFPANLRSSCQVSLP